MSVSEKVLDAIQLLATSSVEKAGYDKTIQAQIVSCEDATIGKYRCRYQDAIIYAYASNSDVTFTNGSYVYILVPGSDMKKEKTILGTTKKLGINYISQAEGDEAYDIIGNNCVTSSNTFYLDSNNKDYKYTLYKAGSSSSEVVLDATALNQYIKQSSSLIVGAIFKTSISPERQYRGHYGITYNLRFLDNTSNQEVIRSYTVDEDNMVDNPYRLVYATRQYQIFNIDGPNFIRVESIEIFNTDFPNATGEITDEKLTSGDIEITTLELSGAVRMSESETNGVAISFYTPQGTFFTDSSTSASYKTITAQVRVKGKLVSAAQSIPFYWGSENVGISPRSEYYNKYIGRGWKCLNDKNVIQSGTETSDPVVEWVPGEDTFILKFDEATARNNKFKVAIVYDGSVVAKEINIQNLAASVPELTIESSGGTKFYYDIGHPTLTCKVNGGEPTGYKYYWAYESNTGVFEELPETTELNTQYENAVAALESLKAEIAAGTKFANAEADNLTNLESNVNAFNFIQRVDGNKVCDVQINNITTVGTFKCSVYNDNDVYLGTCSLALTNTLEGEDLYSLVINNGSAVYQYNENGVAPNNKSLDVQQEIQGLSFTVYDNLGQPIDSDIIANEKNCKIRWYFPIKDTMLTEQSENDPNSGTDATQTYRYYDGKTNLVYGIVQQYDIKKQRNQIKLTIDYKGMNLTAETEFTFTKQGEPGTNGTEYLVKLVPNTRMSNPPLWPMITKAGSFYYLNYGLNSTVDEAIIDAGTGYQLFKAQLWRSGELVWEGFSAADTAIDGITQPSLVNWEMRVNKYNSTISDASAFNVTNASTGRISYSGDKLASDISVPWANIVKCTITWQGKSYYGTIPITTAWTNDINKRVSLKDYTGWRYAIYTSDGVTPQYDSSHPFEFILNEKINGVWEDVSLVEGSHAVSYAVSEVGNYRDTGTGATIEADVIEILTSSVYRDGCEKNQWQARPKSRYGGTCVNAAICCIYRQNDIIVGRINVPIHFLLNKYGFMSINAWDGNSVQLDSEGGFILAPQMGMGKKESDNSFTGVLAGETRIPSKSTSQIGLLGYNKGDRTFFLNSKNGSALFGKPDQGQIIIDPSSSMKKALLYSGNFWKEYNSDGDYDGMPKSYTYRDSYYRPTGNANKAGLLIDLTTPEIYFGTGNFYVTKDGYIHAQAGGDIGGWKIDNHSLYSNVAAANGRITLDAGTYNATTGVVTGPGKIYSHSHSTLTNTGTGFYLSCDGLSFGSKVKIKNTGQMYIGNGAVAGSGKYWTIDGDSSKSYIAYGGTAWSAASDDSGTTAKVYLGTDGISLGTRFSVSPQGQLTAYSGKIGSWTINKSQLSAGNIVLNSNGSMSGGSGDYTWSIATDGKATFNHITANKGGSIGGWTIGSSYLQGGSVTLNKSGALSGENWSISADGIANFSKIRGAVANGYTFTGGGTTITGGGGTNLSTGTTVGGTSLPTYIKNLAVQALNVSESMTFQGVGVAWQETYYVYSVSVSYATSTSCFWHSTHMSSYTISGKTFYAFSSNPSSRYYGWIYNLHTTVKRKRLYSLCRIS